MTAPPSPTVRIQLASGTVGAGDLLAVAPPELTVSFPAECGPALEPGRLISVLLHDAGQGAVARASVVEALDQGGLGLMVTLRLVDPRQLFHLDLGPLREALNQRDVYRTPVEPGAAGWTTVVGLDGRGQARMRAGVAAYLIDVSFDGAGLLVSTATVEELAIWPQVRVELAGERPLRILGTIKHRVPATRGARLGIEAGGPGVRWTPRDEAALRAFVQEQQRLALARRRQPR